MPYTKNADLPGTIRDELPEDAQTIYREAFNLASKKYAIGTKSIVIWIAWAAVKHTYEQINGKWIKISDED